jgi:hypothetical protein
LSCEYLFEFSTKIRNAHDGILRGLGEADSRKNQRLISRDTALLRQIHVDPDQDADPDQKHW